MNVSFLRPLAIVAAVVVAPAAARADYLTGFSGNSVAIQPGQTSDAVINFAVFDNTGATAGLNFFTGTSAAGISTIGTDGINNGGTSSFDKTAKYVYMFQVVNTIETGGSSSRIISLDIEVNPTMVQGFGAFATQGFTEKVGGSPVAITGTGNTRLDGSSTDPASTGINSTKTLDDKGDLSKTSPDAVGLTAIGTFNDMAGLEGGTGPFFPGTGGQSMRFNFSLNANTPSSVLFFTSNVAPVFGTGATATSIPVAGGGTTFFFSYGPTPTPNPAPEPGTMALLGLGLAGVGFRQVRRRMTGKGAPETVA